MNLYKIGILIILVIFATPLITTSAQSAGYIVTSMNASVIPSEASLGDTIDLTTGISDFASNDVLQGELMTIDLIMNPIGSGYASTYSSNVSTVIFSSIQTQQVSGLRLPILGLSETMRSVSWNLKNSGATIISGTILEDEMNDMITKDNAIYFLFGSHQSGKQGDIELLANVSYTLEIGFLPRIDIDYAEALTSTAYVDGVPINIELLDSIQLLDQSVSSSQITGNLKLNVTGIHKIVRYYSDPSTELYYPSFDVQEIVVSSLSNLQINIGSQSDYRYNTILLNASVQYFGSPVFNQKVRFYILNGGVWSYIGSEFTSTQGISSLALDLSYEPGNFKIKVETQYNAETIYSVNTLTVLRPEALLTNVKAFGTFGSGLTDISSIVEVSGYVIDQEGKPLVQYMLNISSPSTSVISVTNSSGYFTAKFEVTDSIGSYLSYFTVNSVSSEYTFQQTSLTMQIAEGKLDIITPKYLSLTSRQTGISISGNITNGNFRSTNASIKLELVGGSSTLIGWKNNSVSFNFVLNNTYFGMSSSGLSLNFGRHTFRISAYKTDFTTEILEIYLDVVPDNVSITREGIIRNGRQVPLGNQIPVSSWIQLNVTKPNLLEFRLLDSASTPISSSQIKIEVLVSGNWELVNYTFTANDGVASTMWQVRKRHVEVNIGIFKVSSINQNYTASHRYFYFDTEKIPFNLQVSTTNTSYGLITEIRGTLTDYTSEVLTDAPLKISLDDDTYFITTDTQGEFTLSRRFLSAGTYEMNVSLDEYYYYFDRNPISYSIIIDKAEYIISSQSITISSGDLVVLEAEVTDIFGNRASSTPISLIYNNSVIYSGYTDIEGKVIYQSSSPFKEIIGNYVFSWIIYESPNYLISQKSTTVIIENIGLSISIDAQNYFYHAPNSATISVIPAVSSPLYPLGNLGIRIEVANITSYLTTDNDGIVLFRMPYDLVPGNYSIIAIFQGNSVFASSNSTTNFTVIGSTIDLAWIEEPSSIVYGDFLSFSFRLTSNGVIMNGINVSISLGTEVWNYITDNEGIMKFNRSIFQEISDSSLIITISPQGGYEELIISRIISVTKIQMNIIGNPMYTVNYSDQASLEFTVTDELSRPIADASVSIYYRINGEGSWVFLTEKSSAANGNLTIYFDTKELVNAGDYVSFKFELSHPNFKSTTLTGMKLNIMSEQIQITYSSQNSTYYQYNLFEFKTTDDEGNAVEGLRIILESSTRGILANGTSDINGYVNLFFEMLGDTDEYFMIYVYSLDGNYQSFSQLLHLNFSKNNAEIITSFVNFNGNPGIQINLRTETMYSIDSSIQIFYSYDNVTWYEMGIGLTSDGQFTFDTDQVLDLMYYKISLNESNTFLGDEVIIVGKLYSLKLNVNDSSVQYGDTFQPNITILEQPPFQFQIIMRIEGTDFTLSYNGNRFSNISLNLPVGDYTVNYILNQQGWIKNENIISSLQILKEKIIVEEGTIFTLIDAEENVTLRVYDDDGIPVPAYVRIVAIIAQEEYFLASGIAGADGLITLTIFIPEDWGVGEFEIVISASNGVNYQGFQGKRMMYVRYPVILNVENTDLILTWSQGINIEVTAFNNFTTEYIDGLQIVVTLVLDGQNVYFEFFVDVTNADGRIYFKNLFAMLFDPGNGIEDPLKTGSTLGVNSQIVITVIENFEYQTSFIILEYNKDFSFQPLEVNVVSEIKGIRYADHQLVLMDIYSSQGKIDLDLLVEESNFYYELFLRGTDRNLAYDSGQLNYQEIDGINRFYYNLNLRGEWELILTVNSPQIKFGEERIIIQIGWNRTVPLFGLNNGDSIEIEYGTEFLETTVTSEDGYLLANISVNMFTPFGSEIITSNENGILILQLPKEMYVPSETSYKISLLISDPNLFISSTRIDIYVIILPINSAFEVSMSDIYIDEKLEIKLESQLENGTYSYEISDENDIIYSGYEISETLLSRLLSTLDLEIGEYTLKIWRAEEYYDPSLKSITFEVLPIPVSLITDILEINNSKFLSITVIDDRTSEIINYSGDFNITIIQGENIYTFYGNSLTELTFEGNFTIIVTINGDFIGSQSIEIATNNSLKQTQSYEQFAEIVIVAGVMVVGFAVTNLKKIKKVVVR